MTQREWDGELRTAQVRWDTQDPDNHGRAWRVEWEHHWESGSADSVSEAVAEIEAAAGQALVGADSPISVDVDMDGTAQYDAWGIWLLGYVSDLILQYGETGQALDSYDLRRMHDIGPGDGQAIAEALPARAGRDVAEWYAERTSSRHADLVRFETLADVWRHAETRVEWLADVELAVEEIEDE